MTTLRKIRYICVVSTCCLAAWYAIVANLTTVNLAKARSHKQSISVTSVVNDIANVQLHSEEPKCSPERHFVYIKTHKTGSTTLYKVVENFAHKHKIKKARKNIRPFLGGYPGHLDLRFVVVSENKRPRQIDPIKDIDKVVFSDHFRYSHSMKKLMPKNTRYFTIIREPWRHFQSAFHYYYGSATYTSKLKETCFQYPFYQVSEGRHNTSIIQYLRKTEKNLNSSVPWFFRSRNYQSFDLGLDPLLEDDEEIEKAVISISLDMDLVLITDYFDQSLILLKELLCLDWSDLLYAEDEGKKHKYIFTDVREYPDAAGIFQKLYKLDTALYKHFNDTLWQKIDVYGRERMDRDVNTLRSMRQNRTERRKRDNRTGFEFSAQHRDLKFYLSDENENALFKFTNLRHSPREMTSLLTRKLRETYDLDWAYCNSMAEYMVANGGGCPI